MENNNNTVVNALSQFISDTIQTYVKSMKGQQITMFDVLNAIMKSYNTYLLSVYTQALKDEITNKANTQDGKSAEKENK